MPPRIHINDENVTKPVKRMRWATQRVTGSGALRKRMSIVKRFHKHAPSAEEKHHAGSHEADGSESSASEEKDTARKIFFNLPLPDDAKDEDGHIRESFARNKIRTAKYTALSFIPKNLWLQFHNIANIYFFFIIILQVRPCFCHILSTSCVRPNSTLRFSPYLERLTQD